MGINSAKGWFSVDRSGKLVLFTDYIDVKKGHSVVFFILYSKRYVEVTFKQTDLHHYTYLTKVQVYSPFGELNSWILIIVIFTSFTFIGNFLNKLKLDIRICSSQDITIGFCLVVTLALISFFAFFFTQHAITRRDHP